MDFTNETKKRKMDAISIRDATILRLQKKDDDNNNGNNTHSPHKHSITSNPVHNSQPGNWQNSPNNQAPNTINLNLSITSSASSSQASIMINLLADAQDVNTFSNSTELKLSNQQLRDSTEQNTHSPFKKSLPDIQEIIDEEAQPSFDFDFDLLDDFDFEDLPTSQKYFPPSKDFLNNFVLLPHSDYNVYRTNNEFTRKWPQIKDALEKPIKNSYDLEKTILSYNKVFSKKWNFGPLHLFFNHSSQEGLPPQHQRLITKFFSEILPQLQKLSLRLPELFQSKEIPLLKAQVQKTLYLSQLEIACLLSHSFFCTFPKRNGSPEYNNFPKINFHTLFCGPELTTSKASKLFCILNYFDRVLISPPTGNVTFHRRVLNNFPRMSQSACKLSDIYVKSIPTGNIEDCKDLTLLEEVLEVDFANQWIGGGVLGNGCVQEEIRFLLSPELIVSCLFTEKLQDNECIIITGTERFSTYSGYGKTFSFEGSYQDSQRHDEFGRKYSKIVAMDALSFSNPESQFTEKNLQRELNKAYLSFLTHPSESIPIATGNWGCGAFRGDPALKAIIQLMAATEASRDLLYFVWGNEYLHKNITQFYNWSKKIKVENGVLWTAILGFFEKRKIQPNSDLFQFLQLSIH